MSSRLVKQSALELPNDEVVLEVKAFASGKMMINAPRMHPAQVCKLLESLKIDVMYNSLEPQKVSPIQSV